MITTFGKTGGDEPLYFLMWNTPFLPQLLLLLLHDELALSSIANPVILVSDLSGNLNILWHSVN